MGKWTDKLYITHAEWSGEVGQHSASAGSAGKRSSDFKRLPFNCCSLSLQPFEHPVCTPEGIIFDLVNIVPYLKKFGTNPVTGKKLDAKDLIKLNFYKNEDGEYYCPVTFKVFSEHTAIAAIKTSGNVFAYDTIERLNIKAKYWRDLVTDETFTRKDIIMIQDPHNMENRDLSTFHYKQNDLKVVDAEAEKERNNPLNKINLTGTTGRVLAEMTGKTDKVTAASSDSKAASASPSTTVAKQAPKTPAASVRTKAATPFNAAHYSQGHAAASLTSTAVGPVTINESALIDEEEFMYKHIKTKSYASLQTNLGNLNIELFSDKTPRTCHNFIQLAKTGYYKGVPFHRSIKNFMIQGGDPTGTGRGGESIWKAKFPDELRGSLSHNERGILSMANSGKDTNGSQFFITYRPCTHLDMKHTIFGKVVGGLDVLNKMEAIPADEDDRPEQPIKIKDIVVFVDPYEEYHNKLEKRLKRQASGEYEQEKKEKARLQREKDDAMGWFGPNKKKNGMAKPTTSIGKYMGDASKKRDTIDDGDDGLPQFSEKKKLKDPLAAPLSQGKHRPPRPRSLNPEPDVPTLDVRWFHAADNPISDPAKIRRARSQTFKSHSGSSSPNPNSSLPPTPKAKAQPSSWIAFSNRDSLALERAYQNGDVTATVAVNEDELFQVDVSSRTISPVYWSGPTYDVRRATWFIQSDGSKWIPCEETLAEQIELGYYKHKPWVVDAIEDPPAKSTTKSTDITESTNATTTAAAEEKKLEKKLEKQPVEKQWMLLGPYMEQYIVYTGPKSAWLLSNTPSGKITKRIYTRLTNNQNLGGTRLLRGYSEVSKQSTNPFSRTVTSSPSLGPAKTLDEVKKPQTAEEKEAKVEEEIEAEEEKQTKREVQDYENEESGDEPRKIDHLVLVIHGIGQKMTERMGSSFVHDVNVLRKTLKTAFPSAIATTSNPSRHNGIQVLPIHWRQDIVFGMASTDETVEADLGMPDADDGPPTLDELTLDGVPNIRMVVSDVLLDIPLYMTPKYRDQMVAIITSEINRVYQLFVKRNPDFLLRGGKVSIYGHSLGSLLAFDVLAVQPFTTRQHESASAIDENRSASHIASNYLPHGRSSYLHFPVQNFFAVGSPLGFMLLLKGCKISSRKLLAGDMNMSSSTISMSTNSSSPIPLCYPAVENLYNIFKQSDPVAYRLEPLISRHYSANIKPETVPFTKGGLKSVIDAGYNVGSGIANRAGAMLESFKMGITTNLFMRGLGLTKQQMYDDMHPQTQKDGAAKEGGSSVRTRSSSDPSPPLNIDLPTTSEDRNKPLLHMASYSYGARKLRMLNSTGRVDWCVQEGLLENPYLNAFTAHTQYWQDLDVAAFIIREMYQQ